MADSLVHTFNIDDLPVQEIQDSLIMVENITHKLVRIWPRIPWEKKKAWIQNSQKLKYLIIKLRSIREDLDQIRPKE